MRLFLESTIKKPLHFQESKHITKEAYFAMSKLAIEAGYLGNEVLKILLPKEAKPIYEKLDKIPLADRILANAIVSVNRAAEDAATAAKPIFIQASILGLKAV